MKTTLDLPDDLLVAAKTLAVRRKTTLKAIVEKALRREIRPTAELENPDPEKYEVGPFCILRIKKCPGATVTLEKMRTIQNEIDAKNFKMHCTQTSHDYLVGY